MMKRQIIILPLLVIFTMLGMIKDGYSSHIVGGELNYRCIGNRTFEVSLIVYRDCFFGDPLATFDNPAWVGIFTPNGQLQTSQGAGGILFSDVPPPISDTLRETLMSECFVQGNPVCVERAVYRDTITLAFNPAGYILVYQRCCRNETILNITEPDQTGSSFWAYIPPSVISQTECNSNPIFNDYPPIFVCANEDVNFDHSATDLDGDEIVYELTTPSSALTIDNFRVEQFDDFDEPMGLPIPFDLVTFQAPYNLQNLLGGDSPLTLDSQTGQLTGIPTTVGQFLVGVSAKEFRNGVFLSETRRDFQYNVRICGERPLAAFTPNDFNCESLQVDFENTGTGNTFEWSFGDGSTSTEMSPSYTYAEAGIYDVQLLTFVSDVCSDTANVTLAVNGIVASDIIADDEIINCEENSSIIANVQTNLEVTIEWALNADFDPVVFTGIEYNISGLEENTIVYVRLTDENGCVLLDNATLIVSSIVASDIIADDEIINCEENSSIIANVQTNLEVTIEWALNADFDPVVFTGIEYDISGLEENTIVYVRLTDENGCILLDNATLIVSSIVAGDIIEDDEINVCEGVSSIVANVQTELEATVEWALNADFDPVVFTGIEYDISGLQANTTVYVRLTDENGCIFTDQADIDVSTTIGANFGSDIASCGDLNVNFTSTNADLTNVMWDFGDLSTDTDVSTELNPSYIYGSGGVYIVTLSGLAGICDASSSMDVAVIGNNIISMSDVSSCNDLPVILNEGGSDLFDYLWTPSDGLDQTDIASPTATVTGPMTYFVTISDPNDPTCSFEDTVRVAIEDFGFNGADLDFCSGVPIVLNASGSPDFIYEWSPADGLDQTDVASPTATVTEATTYIVTITDPDDPNCIFSGEINLVPIDFGLNTDDAYSCFGNPAILNEGGRTDLVYNWSPSDGLDQTDIASPTASVSTNTTYNVTVSLLNSPECLFMTTVDVIVVDEPYDVSVDQNVVQCPDQSVVLSLIDNDGRNLTYEWYDNNFTQPPLSTSTSVSVQVDEPSSFFVVVSISGNCPDTTQINVTIDSSFEVSVAIDNDRVFCPGDQVTAQVTSAIPPGGTIIWNPPATGTDVSTTFIATVTSNVVATVTSAAGCSESGSALLTVSNFSLNASASPACITETTDIQLSATAGAVSYSWVANPVTEILNPTSANTTAPQVNETTMFTVTIVDENGCTFEASTTVSFMDDCACQSNEDYPNYFSPNGDDINDIFTLNYTGITFISMLIYDRWGNEVFSTTSENEFWDGTSGGSERPQDVYGYLIRGTCPDQSALELGGNVTIFR